MYGDVVVTAAQPVTLNIVGHKYTRIPVHITSMWCVMCLCLLEHNIVLATYETLYMIMVMTMMMVMVVVTMINSIHTWDQTIAPYVVF